MADIAFGCLSNDALLAAFLNGDPKAGEALHGRLQERLLSRARSVAPKYGLASLQLDEDIVQELWAILSRKKGSRFDPSRGTADGYLSRVLDTAARDVRAKHAPPGHPTRPRKDTNGKTVKYEPALSLDRKLDDGISFSDLLADDSDAFAVVDARIDAERLLVQARETAPAPVFRALLLIYLEELTLSQAAEAVGLDRFTLRRLIDRWADKQGMVPAVR